MNSSGRIQPITSESQRLATYRVVRERDLLHLVLPDEVLEVAVGDGVAALKLEEERLSQCQQHQEAEDVPHRAAGRPWAGAPLAKAAVLRRRVWRCRHI